MATSTTNLGLTKPAGTDKIRIAQINGNMDILDEKIGAVGNTSLQAQLTSQNQAISTINSNISQVINATSLSVLESSIMTIWTAMSNLETRTGYARINFSDLDVYIYGGIASVVISRRESGVYLAHILQPNGIVATDYYYSGAHHWGAVTNRILKTNAAISIPSSGTSATYTMAGITANHELTRWNFSSSAENNPPANLTWTTEAGSFTITNNGGTTSETIKPVFELPATQTATAST